MVGTSLRALLIRNRLTGEGESIPLCHYPVELETETTRSDGFIFLKWPVTVVHWIKDDSSPLWDLSAEDLLGAVHFEIIVVMEGTIESTGMLTQVWQKKGPIIIRQVDIDHAVQHKSRSLNANKRLVIILLLARLLWSLFYVGHFSVVLQ